MLELKEADVSKLRARGCGILLIKNTKSEAGQKPLAHPPQA